MKAYVIPQTKIVSDMCVNILNTSGTYSSESKKISIEYSEQDSFYQKYNE